jgi:hypothetical protein
VGTAPGNDWTEQAVNLINRAIRWAWLGDDPFFAWPQTLTVNAAVAVATDIIAWSEVSSSDWVSFWRSDPRVAPDNTIPAVPYSGYGFGGAVPPVPVTWDGTQFNVQDTSVGTPVFAFYRTAVPQGTFVLAASNPTYATPTVPDFFRDAVVNYAAAEYFDTAGEEVRGARFRAKAEAWEGAKKAGILNSEAGYPWKGNVITT